MLPDYFKPILWSYDWQKLDPEQHRQTIVTATLNYGGLRHWGWLMTRYGRRGVQAALAAVPRTAIRPGAARLARLIFGTSVELHAPRRSHA